MRRGYSPPQSTRGSGERRELPSGVRGGPRRKTNFVHSISITEHFWLQDIVNRESVLQAEM